MKEIMLSPLPLNEFEILVENSLRRVFTEQTTSTNQTTEIIDRSELCKRLAITEPTAIRWEKKGKIPCFRIGSSVRYNWPKVIEALENKKGGEKMRKHFNTPGKYLQPKGNELYRVFAYLGKHTATASMVAIALNIHRPNICRYKRRLEKTGRLAETKKGNCKITKHRAAYLTTNPDLFPIHSQLNLFK